MSLKDELSQLALFSDLPEEALLELSALGDVEEYEASEVISRQGEAAKNLYGILKGEVDLHIIHRNTVSAINIIHEHSRVHVIEEQDRPLIIERLGPGDIFSWSAVVGSGILTATATCRTPSRLMALPSEALRSLMEQRPDIGYPIMCIMAEVICRRRQQVTDKLVELWVEHFDHEHIDW